MDLNWCPVCEQHIPLAWESSLYCSDRCKQADAMSTSMMPQELNNVFSRQHHQQRNSVSYSPMSSPTLVGVKSSSSTSGHSLYPSPPTSPNGYLYNKTSSSGRISPPAFSLGGGQDMLEFRRKSTISLTSTTTSGSNAKKGFFW
ncbi:hypothetical protein BG004_002822 [Podila humilis]|nr:hypothetical protein BG004_002822 [Podila humilis]